MEDLSNIWWMLGSQVTLLKLTNIVHNINPLVVKTSVAIRQMHIQCPKNLSSIRRVLRAFKPSGNLTVELAYNYEL